MVPRTNKAPEIQVLNDPSMKIFGKNICQKYNTLVILS